MKGDTSSDIALQHRFVREGDQDALQGLLQIYGPRLYDYLLRVTDNEALAKDAFFTLTKHLVEKPYRGEKHLFVGWLFGLAVQAAKVLPAKKSAYQDKQVSLGEEATFAKKMILSLPTELRSAFLLSHFAQLLPEEIAIALQIPKETAVSQVEQAVDSIRQAMQTKREA